LYLTISNVCYFYFQVSMPANKIINAPVGTESLGFYLSRATIVFRALLKKSLSESSLSDHIKPGMGNLMFALYEKDGQTKTELAGKLLLSKMTITRLVRGVEKHGLVKITTDKNDARANRVHLSPLAKEVEKEYRQLALNLEERISSRFTSEQLSEFRGHLKILLQSLDDELI